MLTSLLLTSNAQKIAKGIYLGMSKVEFNKKANPHRPFISQEYYISDKRDLTDGDYLFIEKNQCVFKNGKLHTLVLSTNYNYVLDNCGLRGGGNVGISRTRISNWLRSLLGNKLNISIKSEQRNELSYQCCFVIKISK